MWPELLLQTPVQNLSALHGSAEVQRRDIPACADITASVITAQPQTERQITRADVFTVKHDVIGMHHRQQISEGNVHLSIRTGSHTHRRRLQQRAVVIRFLKEGQYKMIQTFSEGSLDVMNKCSYTNINRMLIQCFNNVLKVLAHK